MVPVSHLLEAEAAQARYEAAQLRAQSLVFQIMALLKVSPAEFEMTRTEKGELTFKPRLKPVAPSGQ